MAVFLVLPMDLAKPGAIQQVLENPVEGQKFDYLTLPVNGFLVNFPGTTQELSDAMGISDGGIGGAMVTHVSSFWGWGPNNVWEWMNSRWAS